MATKMNRLSAAAPASRPKGGSRRGLLDIVAVTAAAWFLMYTEIWANEQAPLWSSACVEARGCHEQRCDSDRAAFPRHGRPGGGPALILSAGIDQGRSMNNDIQTTSCSANDIFCLGWVFVLPIAVVWLARPTKAGQADQRPPPCLTTGARREPREHGTAAHDASCVTGSYGVARCMTQRLSQTMSSFGVQRCSYVDRDERRRVQFLDERATFRIRMRRWTPRGLQVKTLAAGFRMRSHDRVVDRRRFEALRLCHRIFAVTTRAGKIQVVYRAEVGGAGFHAGSAARRRRTCRKMRFPADFRNDFAVNDRRLAGDAPP